MWIKMFLFMILMLQFTVNEQLSSSVAVRAGDDVTLTCEHVKDDKCLNTQWMYNNPDHTRTDALVRGGQTERSTSDRLSVGEKCSLVIEKVTGQDAGLYTCKQDGDSEVHLSVVTLTEHKLMNAVGFYCYVSTHKRCKPSVKWLHQGEDVYGDRKNLNASEIYYYALVTFEDSQVIYASVLTSLTCEVIDCRTNVHQFPFRPQASDKDGSESAGSVEISLTTLRIVLVSVGLTTLIIIVVTVDIWIRTKGNKTQMNQNTVDDDDGDEGTATYENAGASSASV